MLATEILIIAHQITYCRTSKQEWGHERLVRAQQAVELRPYDIEAWAVMLREAQTRHVNDVRSLYESLVVVFPTTARYWRIYIEQEIKVRNYERVEKVSVFGAVF